MMSARCYGKEAKLNDINAPTLDQHFYLSIQGLPAEERIFQLSEWWEGWYESLDLVLNQSAMIQHTPKSSHDITQSAL